jgi:hypothetical protein
VPDGEGIDVLVPAARRRASTGHVRVHPTRRPTSVWVIDGVRPAEPHRAVIDAGRRLTRLQDVRGLVLAAVCQRWCSIDRLRAELEAGPRNGTALCRRAIRDAEAGAWSAPEAEVADVAAAAVRDGRLPPFLLNPTLLLDGVVIGVPDGWLLGLGLGWEVESRRHHSSDPDFDATLARHDGFAAHGLQLLHVTPRRARLLGAAYAQVLADAVGGRRRAVVAEPPGLVVRPYDPRTAPVRRPPQGVLVVPGCP